MEAAEWQRRLRSGAVELGLALPEGAADRLWRHWELVKEAGRQFNLTAIQDDAEALVVHYLDSLAPAARRDAWPGGGVLVDVGSGAGFPGIPLRVALGDGWRAVLVEAQQKKAAFLARAAGELGLRDVVVRAQRAEEAGRDPALREAADVAVARALARLDVLAEYALPLLRVGGRLWVYKGPRPEEEVAACTEAVRRLGGEIALLWRFALPLGGGPRSLLLIEKRQPTPAGFPRRPGVPAKRPLAGRAAAGPPSRAEKRDEVGGGRS